MAPPSPDLLVVGAGLAGGLLALEAAALGARVTLVAGAPMATAISYGGVPWWAGADDRLGLLQATAPGRWRALEACHGPLGHGPAELWLHWPQGQDPSQALAGLAALPHGPEFQWLEPQQWRREAPLLAEAAVGGFVALPYGRVDPFAFQLGLDRALDRLGVSRGGQRLERLISSHGQVLGGVCPKGQQLLAGQTVLCAGAASGALLLPLGVELPLLSFSWAAVLALAGLGLGGPRILMPLQGKRALRELQGGPDLVCDPGLAPWGEGLLLGQTSVFAGALALNPGLPPAEAPLRRGLEAAAAQLLPTLSPRQLDQAPLLQQPVAYSRDGRPLVGPLASLPGLAVFTGFAGPFALAPVLAPLLARALLGGEADRRELEALELSPDRPLAG